MPETLPKELQSLLDALPTLTPAQKVTAIKALDSMGRKAERIHEKAKAQTTKAEEVAKQAAAAQGTAQKFVTQVTEVMATVAHDVAGKVTRTMLQPAANRRTMQK